MSISKPEVAIYSNQKYERTLQMECQALFGMSNQELHRREVGLVTDTVFSDIEERPLDELKKEAVTQGGIPYVDSLRMNIKPGSKVLDIACGEGDTSRTLAEMGAFVEARDYADGMIERAIQRNQEVAEDVRARVAFAIGDMTNIGDSLSDSNKQFDAVTCLGKSFAYLGDHPDYMKALKSWFEVLKPGGTVALQWREHLGIPSNEAIRAQGMVMWDDEDPAKHEAGIYESVVRDIKRKDGMRMGVVDQDKRNSAGVHYQYLDKTYLESSNPDRVVSVNEKGQCLDIDGNVIPDIETPMVALDETGKRELSKFTNYLKVKNLPLLKQMLEQTGFVNIRVKGQKLAADGTSVIYAIAADKPTV
jgi:ubiquinone/menaquinone biosynthesis C-methylase UbiE